MCSLDDAVSGRRQAVNTLLMQCFHDPCTAAALEPSDVLLLNFKGIFPLIIVSSTPIHEARGHFLHAHLRYILQDLRLPSQVGERWVLAKADQH